MVTKKRDRVPSIYTEEELLKYWGKLNPTLNERSIQYNIWWKQWEKNVVNLREVVGMVNKFNVHQIRKYYGFCNVVIRGNEARFRNSEDALACFFQFYDEEGVKWLNDI